MMERPILFGEAMVRAILDGRKTQTRRVIKPQPLVCGIAPDRLLDWKDSSRTKDKAMTRDCPFGQVGDRLWVRETFRTICSDANSQEQCLYKSTSPQYGPWKPSSHMPRWASRITLEITGVRVERLQDITEADAMAEGASNQIPCGCRTGTRNKVSGGTYEGTFIEGFMRLWESIYGNPKDKDGYLEQCSWRDNPWVWVVEFKMMKGGE